MPPPAWLVPPRLQRALLRARARLARLLAETPLLFLAVVLGVGLTFRVVLVWAHAVPETPTFVMPAARAGPATPAAPEMRAAPDTGRRAQPSASGGAAW